MPRRVLLLGGTSEIGLAILAALGLPPEAEVILAGRDTPRLAAAAQSLPCQVQTVPYDATDTSRHAALAETIFATGELDMVISAAGLLTPQADLDRDPAQAADMIDANFTGHVTPLLAIAAQMRVQGHGTIVVLSSVAAVRPRKANFVYGAAKAGLDAFARGLADSLHNTGVQVILVRPGFVAGRMTAHLPPPPLATTPQKVAAATTAALRRTHPPHTPRTVWIPPSFAPLSLIFRLIPPPLWRRISR
jgi:decaprenylphospho-beta-D-erythro-pentofuranosid-2-ulose 2-reductase